MAEYVQDSERIGVIPNGFDEKRFRPISHENQVTQFITVCRLVPAKGLDTLLIACGELKKTWSSLCSTYYWGWTKPRRAGENSDRAKYL